jgi:hypothetical protein
MFCTQHEIASLFTDSLYNNENIPSSDLAGNKPSATMGRMESIPSPHKMVEEREQ